MKKLILTIAFVVGGILASQAQVGPNNLTIKHITDADGDSFAFGYGNNETDVCIETTSGVTLDETIVYTYDSAIGGLYKDGEAFYQFPESVRDVVNTSLFSGDAFRLYYIQSNNTYLTLETTEAAVKAYTK